MTPFCAFGFPKSIIQKNTQFFSFAFVVIFTVSACGGSEGESTLESEQNSLIIGGTSGSDAAEVSEDQLRLTAARSAGAGIGVNLNGLVRLNDAENATSTDGGILAGVGDTADTQSIELLETSNSNFLNNSLGIDDPGARITREGNVITIDPDDQRICGDDLPLAEGFNDDQLECQQLASDLIVQVNAQSDESGIITYLFQDAPVLLIGYSSQGASYEINLSGVQSVMRRADELNDEISDFTTSMSGALRLSGTVFNEEEGQEAGELALEVTETITFEEADSEAGLTLEPSTVFKLALNEATGDVSMVVDWGALQSITREESSSFDGTSTSSTTVLNLGGLSAELIYNENQTALKVTNIGIGDVPITMTINSIESVNLTLEKFGITVNPDSNTINLDGALNAKLMLDNLAGVLDNQAPEFTASATLSAPANSVLVEQENGSTLLSEGGPLEATVFGGDASQSSQVDVLINAGECFDSARSTTGLNAATSAIANVPCDL